MALSDDDKHVKASNARRMWRRGLSGKVTGAKSGWNTLTFSRALEADPGVVATALGQGAAVEVRNVSKTGFDYQVTGTPSGQDVTFFWRADVPEQSASPLIDDINEALGTSFRTIGELLSSNTGMASLAGNETARNLLLGVPDLYPQVANSQNAVNQLFGNDAAYAAVKAKPNLLNQIKASGWGYAKWWIREAGETEVGEVVSMETLFADSHFPNGISNVAMGKDLLSSAARVNSVVTSGRALNLFAKTNATTRALANGLLQLTKDGRNINVAVATIKSSHEYFRVADSSGFNEARQIYYGFAYVNQSGPKGVKYNGYSDATTSDNREAILKKVAADVPEACIVYFKTWNGDNIASSTATDKYTGAIESLDAVRSAGNRKIYTDNNFSQTFALTKTYVAGGVPIETAGGNSTLAFGGGFGEASFQGGAYSITIDKDAEFYTPI